jgi:hypothetical protein
MSRKPSPRATVESSPFSASILRSVADPIPGTQCKNLCLRNKKGDKHHLSTRGNNVRVIALEEHGRDGP